MVFSGVVNYNQNIKHPKKYHLCFYATDLKIYQQKRKLTMQVWKSEKNRYSSLFFLVGFSQIEPERAKIGHYEMCHKLMNSIYERIKAVCTVREFFLHFLNYT